MSYTAAAYQQMLSLAGYTAAQAQQAALSANARSTFQPSFAGKYFCSSLYQFLS